MNETVRQLVAADATRQAIRDAVERGLAGRFDGPGLTWRGYLVANVLHEIADADVLYPSQRLRLIAAMDALIREADDNLEDEWPK